jgi:hypothetical protein
MVAKWLKRISIFLARMPGVPVFVAVGLVVLNLILQFLPDWPVVGWLAHTHLLLHIGLIVGFLGVLLGDAL